MKLTTDFRYSTELQEQATEHLLQWMEEHAKKLVMTSAYLGISRNTLTKRLQDNCWSRMELFFILNLPINTKPKTNE